MTKRTSCLILAALMLVATSGRSVLLADGPVTPNRDWTNTSLVHTVSGVVQGVADKQDTWVWRGVPYAAPPVGELRWRAPRPPVPWTGVLQTRRFASPCSQFSPIIPGLVVGSEDCLYLNVWRPKSTETNLPVYVWIHGGGNSIGSASFISDYYGHALASRSNMIFVSLNFRLGPFGWFTHSALRGTSGDTDDGSGNYGTLDIIAALEWIKANIRAFGGDPSRVVISGESAGGTNVASLLISPRASGLFSHALIQSGSPRLSTVEQGDASSSRVLRHLLSSDRQSKDAPVEGQLSGMNDGQIQDYLRGKTDREIMKAYTTGTTGMIGSPAIFNDGRVIPQEGYSVIENGTYANQVPTILGTNREETKLFLSFSRSMDWRGDLYQAVGGYGSMFWKADAVDGFARKITDNEGHPPVYAYRFDWGSIGESGLSPLPGNWGKRLGATHTFEIPFFLGTDSLNGPLYTSRLFTRRNRPGRKALSGLMMDYASSFVRTGDPNALPGATGIPRPVWSPWSNSDGSPKYVVFDADDHEPTVTMSSAEVTHSSIYAQMAAELEPSLYEETLRHLGRDAAAE